MPAQHHQSRKHIDTGIFDNVGSFRVLEERIAGLPTTKDVGDAFEIFVEGYLATQKIMQAEKVWPVGQIPFDIRHKMNLPANTKGVDGLFRTILGELVPYQVKFRTLAEPLTYTEVSSFLGLTERARDRVIFTNARDVARDAKTRDAIRTVRAQDFNSLTPEDFSLIESWLKHTPVEPPKRVPRPYQQEAIERIIETFRTADRATAVMACGSGKTLVALWVAEAMSVRRVIVFVPSLALLSQTLKEWSRWTSWGSSYRYLCVCSDPTVSQGMDDIRLNQIDTEFPISTNREEVRRFLQSNGSGIQVIFSTYQSSPVIMEGAEGLGPFDLAILDEAHKTTGVQGSAFALPLLHEKIHVKKRLFLTATPRHYDIHHRDRAGDFRVISMDNPVLYGPVSYRLTFADAAKKGIICNYKVVVSVVDGKEVTEFALAHGITLVDKSEIAVRWVAHQLALQKAIKKVKATRVITFHSTVRLAQRFASSDVEGIARHLNRFSVHHVNGEQPSAEREDRLTAFREAKRGIITNARCLTEGVDVPAVDMIAFMNPRKSRVDIAQATGRAMRKAGPKKTFGYVVVPLFLNKHRGESIEKALERSDFVDVANVLNAMQEQDADLVDIIREMREARGRFGGFRPTRLREKLQVIGPRISLDRLRSNIFVRVVDQLGAGWDEYYGKLVAYRKKHLHCNVPHLWQEDKSLGMWVAGQRRLRMKGHLTPERIRKLDLLGLVWDLKGARWAEMYGKLAAFKKQHGNCDLLRSNPDPQLSNWVGTQRAFRVKGSLQPDRIRKLEVLGFSWDVSDAFWERQYAQLAAYKKQHGHCNRPRTGKANDSLAMWISNQRILKSKNRLSAERTSKLSALGFIWDLHSSQWEEMYLRLIKYKDRYKNCNVPMSWKNDRSLAIWVGNMRHRIDELSSEQIQRLNGIGFDWTPISNYWERMYARLLAYRKQHGHCNVPSTWEQDRALAGWVIKQRNRDNPLPSDRIKQLNAIGFDWKPYHSSWEQMLARIIKFKAEHGHCNVSRKHDQILARWVCKQRKWKAQGRLSQERRRRLTALGFSWETDRYQRWEEMYGRLVEYREKYGHCNVRRGSRALLIWITHQRQLKAKGTLLQERVNRLDELGLDWDPKGTSWEQKYLRLAAYKSHFGDCNVPHKWEKDRPLGMWVAGQRRFKIEGYLTPKRTKKLDSLGFDWNPFNNFWEEMYGRLVAYKKQYGDCSVPRGWKQDRSLGTWVSTQRHSKTLTAERIRRLDSIKFAWSTRGQSVRKPDEIPKPHSPESAQKMQS